MKYFKLILIGILLLPSLGYGDGSRVDVKNLGIKSSSSNSLSGYIFINELERRYEADPVLIELYSLMRGHCLDGKGKLIVDYDSSLCSTLNNDILTNEARVKDEYLRERRQSGSSTSTPTQGGTAGGASSSAAYDPCAGTKDGERVNCVKHLATRDTTIAKYDRDSKMVLGGLASGTAITFAAISAKAERKAGEQFYGYYKGLNDDQRRARQYITAPQFFSTSALNPEFPLFAMSQNQNLGALYLMGEYGFFNQTSSGMEMGGGMTGQGNYNPLANPWNSYQSTMNWFNSPYGMGPGMYGNQNPYAFAGNTRNTGGFNISGRYLKIK